MFNNYEGLTEHLNVIFSMPNYSVENGYASIEPETLYILDNYAVSYAKKMTPEIAADFASSIAMVYGIREVNVYMRREITEENRNSCLFFREKSLRKWKKNLEKKDIDESKKEKQRTEKREEIEGTYNNIRRFMETLEKRGKRCNFIAYNAPKPKLHGRYWFNDHSGLIVDGSMNSTPTNIVLAQELDDENYGIISKFFDKVIYDDEGNICFNLENIDDAYKKAVAFLEGTYSEAIDGENA